MTNKNIYNQKKNGARFDTRKFSKKNSRTYAGLFTKHTDFRKPNQVNETHQIVWEVPMAVMMCEKHKN